MVRLDVTERDTAILKTKYIRNLNMVSLDVMFRALAHLKNNVHKIYINEGKSDVTYIYT